jgi:5-methylcytosine-specific restriction endonuclease McrA
MPRSKGRTGRPWRRIREQVLAASTICHLCGHAGADTVDHVIPVSKLPHNHPLVRDPANLRPAHRSCNSAKGAGRKPTPKPQTSRNW